MRAVAALMIGSGLLRAAEPGLERLPAPHLTLAALRDLGFRVGGELEAMPAAAYDLLLFAVPDCASGNLSSNLVNLGTVAVHTDATGHAVFTRALDVHLHDTQCLMARTMDGTGDTSEFSNPLPVSIELTYWEDVAVILTGSTNAARPGEPFGFRVTLENRSEAAGPRPELSGLTATVPIPDGARFLSASEGGVLDGATVRFPGLTVKGDEPLTLGVSVVPLLVETLVGTAAVDHAGPYQANNHATLVVPVDTSGVGRADLALALTATPPPVRAGMELRYGLSITNQGPDGAPEVVLTNRLPPTVRFLRAETSQGHATFADGVVACTLGPMSHNASAQITVSVQPVTPGFLTNVAGVGVPSGLPALPPGWLAASRSEGEEAWTLVTDPNPTNNQAVAVVEVLPAQPLEVLGTPGFNAQTGLFEQVVRFTNVGTEPWSGVRLRVGGVSSDVLVLNRSGLDDAGPYLQLGRRLEAAETYEFTVEFYHADRRPVETPAYAVVEHAGDSVGPPPDPGQPAIVLHALLGADGCVLSWGAVPGRVHLVQAQATLPEPWRTVSSGLIFATDQGTWTDPAAQATNAASPESRFFRVLRLP